MRDFLKIFIVLCLLVGAFMYGRNYGELTYRESEEYKSLVKAKEDLTFVKADLENAKVKLQNIIDGAENKKQEELLAQILQVFLVDLGLRVSDHQANSLNKTATVPPTAPEQAKPALQKSTKDQVVVESPKEEKKFDIKKLKSYEWILTNSATKEDLAKNLKNVEIRNLNLFLQGARAPAISEFEPIFGSYRGRIDDVNQKEYGSMLIEINANQQSEKPSAKGNIKIFRENSGTMENNFSTNTLGFSVEGSTSFVINPGNDNKFYQLYKIKETQQLAGFFYERLANGTTKTIGSFVLNRVDQF